MQTGIRTHVFEELFHRTPPHDMECERLFLGALLLSDRTTAGKLFGKLRPADFHCYDSQHLYRLMRSAYQRKGVWGDTRKLAAHLLNKATILRRRSICRLFSVNGGPLTYGLTSQLNEYSRRIMKLSRMRGKIKAAERAYQRAWRQADG